MTMAVLLEWMRKLGQKVKPHAVLKPSAEGQLPRMAVVAGFSRYAVTEDGQIINRKRKLLLRQAVHKNGYRYVCITDDTGKRRHQYVHRIVLAAFTPNPEGYSDSHHIDSDKTNNHRLNLQWVTHKQNLLHMRDFISSRADSHYRLTMADATVIRKRSTEGGTQAELAGEYGVSQTTVSAILRNINWHDPNYSPQGRVRLSDEDVAEVKRAHAAGVSCTELAGQFGYTLGGISHIVKGRRRRQDNQNIQPATAETTEGDDDGSTSDI
jgi:hypothetical protein